MWQKPVLLAKGHNMYHAKMEFELKLNTQDKTVMNVLKFILGIDITCTTECDVFIA